MPDITQHLSSVQRDDERVETPRQLAARVNVSERKIRELINTNQLEHVRIGCRQHIPVGAWGRFLEAKKVTACPDEIRDRGCTIARIEASSTSPGPSTVAAASAALARQTANELKQSSGNGSESEAAKSAQVIRAKF